MRLPNGLFIAAALDRLRRELLETGWDRFGVGEFKDRFGLTRKWAIPLLECSTPRGSPAGTATSGWSRGRADAAAGGAAQPLAGSAAAGRSLFQISRRSFQTPSSTAQPTA